MHIGLVPINVGFSDPEIVVVLATKAEEVGLESVFTFEHVIVPVEYASRYPYHAKGKMAATPETPFIDPLIALAFVAGATTRIRLGTGVNILPQTNPLLAAKQVASLDCLSGGRFLYGVGIGWLKEEFEALSVPFEQRGRRFDDYIVAMKKVWSGEVVEHESELLHWHGFKSLPTPVQRPHPPLIIGGTTDAAFVRVAQHGDGWIAPNDSIDDLAPRLARFREVAHAAGRDPSTLSVTAMWVPRKEPDALSRYEDLGVDRLIAPIYGLQGGSPMEGIELLGDVLAKR
jgi:probable F420-dependent oxidoreductase